MDVAGKVAVVTGAAMGIGRAVAEALAEEGAVVVMADRQSEAGKEAAAAVGGLFVRADVADDDDLRRMFETADRFGGGLDIVVNNAGGVDDPVYPEASPEQWGRVLDVNLRAVMLATQLALDPLRRRGGAVVNVASVAGLGAGAHGAPEYAAAKAGVVRLTAALRSLASEGIRVNAVCPDYVDTPAVRRTLAEMTEEERRRVPELVAPEAVAGGILDLVRDDSLAGRVLVWFAEEEPYLLPEAVPTPGEHRVFRPAGISYLRIPARDPHRVADFYGAVFGWSLRRERDDPAFEDGSGHVIGHFVADQAVAGEAGVRPYVFVERLDDVLAKVGAEGGEVVTPPYPEGDLWVATIRDPAGNVVGVWQAGPREP